MYESPISGWSPKCSPFEGYWRFGGSKLEISVMSQIQSETRKKANFDFLKTETDSVNHFDGKSTPINKRNSINFETFFSQSKPN